MILVGCPGSLSNPERFTGEVPDGGPLADTGGPGSSRAEAILAESCAGMGCHGAMMPALNLDLVTPGVAARLTGQAAVGCASQTLLVPGDADASFLFNKIDAETPSCGGRMPLLRDPLSSADISEIRAWIDAMPSTSRPDAGPAAMPDAAMPMGDPCQPIADTAGLVLCDRAADRCTGEFTAGEQCSALCAAAGLVCVASYENIGSGDCMFDMTMPLSCSDLMHMSDYCECGRP